jgi:hypothetical protein
VFLMTTLQRGLARFLIIMGGMGTFTFIAGFFVGFTGQAVPDWVPGVAVLVGLAIGVHAQYALLKGVTPKAPPIDQEWIRKHSAGIPAPPPAPARPDS